MGHEIELKLELDPKDARTLADQELLRDSKSRSERLVSVYYDTPGGKLRKSGYSLRVRSTPDGYVQTIKTLESGAGLFFRQEWEAAVDSIEPHVEELARTPAGEVGAKRLRPVVCSAIDRTRWDVHDHHSELEISLDDGDLRADERDQPVCELEIELKKGEPAAAFRAARKIAHHIPLRLGVLSKAERAFALADGLFGKPTKAEPVPVRSDMSVAEGLATILQSCIRHFRLNEPLVAKDRDSDALHQTRVAMRRLRSALSLFRPAIADEEYPRLREELRWFVGQLGEARNLDVYLQQDMPKQERKHLLKLRNEAYDRVIEALDSRRFLLLMIDLTAWASLGKWRSGDKADRPLPPFAEKRISRLWLKICGHDNISAMQDEERHRLRIEIKKLRYALDFMQPLHAQHGRRQKQFSKLIEGLQQSLGRLNDLVTARAIAGTDVSQEVDARYADERAKCLREAGKLLNRLKLTGPYWTQSPRIEAC